MTDNIQRLYEISGVDYEERYNNCTLNKEAECRFKSSCDICNYSEERYIYPTFTAEKQLELIKWLGKLAPFNISFSVDAWYIKVVSKNKNLDYLRVNHNFDNGIVDLILDLWQDLTEEQKQEIKRILE